MVIDAENRSFKHLGQIADSMYEWQGAVADHLGLPPADVAAIHTKHPTQLKLQTYVAQYDIAKDLVLRVYFHISLFHFLSCGYHEKFGSRLWH